MGEAGCVFRAWDLDLHLSADNDPEAAERIVDAIIERCTAGELAKENAIQHPLAECR